MFNLPALSAANGIAGDSTLRDSPGEKILKRFEAADAKRRLWTPIMQDCHQYALPNRQDFWVSTEGQRKTDLIFDSTAVVSTQEFASRLQAGLTPNYDSWADFVPGPDVPEHMRAQVAIGLEDIRDLFFDLLSTSNFNSQSHECYTDLAIGTCAMLVESGDLDHCFKFTAVPLTEVWIETGAFGRINAVFRPMSVLAEEIVEKWPDADLSCEALKDALEKDPRRPINLIEATIRDISRRDTEVHHYTVLIYSEPDQLLVERTLEGEGSNPWIIGRWSLAAGETYGRGPLIAAMPDIKTANMIVELILESGEMAIAGLWQFEDDGSINPDTINLVPGAMIPHGMGSKGLEPLAPSGDFTIAFDVLKDFRDAIKRALFDEMLGSPDKTPMSATEVHVRMAEMARRIGSPYGRLQYEFIQPLVARCLYLMRARNLISLPRVNGRFVRVVPTSPLAHQQKYATEVQAIEQLLQVGTQSFGPQMINLYFDGPKTMDRLRQDLGVPKEVIRPDADRQALMQQIAQLAQAAQQQPGAVPGQAQGSTAALPR